MPRNPLITTAAPIPSPVPTDVMNATIGQAMLIAASPSSPARFPIKSPSMLVYVPTITIEITDGRI